MPEPLRSVSLGFPARHFTELARGLALKGSEPEQLWPQMLALVVYTAAVLALTVRRFHGRMG
jgi:ABC-2 type transport system permease protein